MLTKNLNWEILTINLVTFKMGWGSEWKILISSEFTEKSSFSERGRGVAKNQYIGENCRRGGLDSLQIQGGGPSRKRGRSDTPMDTMRFLLHRFSNRQIHLTYFSQASLLNKQKVLCCRAIRSQWLNAIELSGVSQNGIGKVFPI